jgi:hypothetical protein
MLKLLWAAKLLVLVLRTIVATKVIRPHVLLQLQLTENLAG